MGGGTICLGAGVHPLSTPLVVRAQKGLQIIGVSSLRTTIQQKSATSLWYVSIDLAATDLASQLLLAGFRLTGGLYVSLPPNHSRLTLDSLHVEGEVRVNQMAGGYSPALLLRSRVDDGLALANVHGEVRECRLYKDKQIPLDLQYNAETMDVLVDGCDIRGATSPAVSVYLARSEASRPISSGRVRVQNSYIHDSLIGVELRDFLPVDDTRPRTIDVSLINNTVVNSGQQALNLVCRAPNVTWNVTYANNVLYGSSVGVAIPDREPATLVHRNNALFANLTDYTGKANSGGGYITQDPLLDKMLSPWAPAENSPLRGAADPLLAAPYDYWGHPRLPAADIGCTQFLAQPPTGP